MKAMVLCAVLCFAGCTLTQDRQDTQGLNNQPQQKGEKDSARLQELLKEQRDITRAIKEISELLVRGAVTARKRLAVWDELMALVYKHLPQAFEKETITEEMLKSIDGYCTHPEYARPLFEAVCSGKIKSTRFAFLFALNWLMENFPQKSASILWRVFLTDAEINVRLRCAETLCRQGDYLALLTVAMLAQKGNRWLADVVKSVLHASSRIEPQKLTQLTNAVLVVNRTKDKAREIISRLTSVQEPRLLLQNWRKLYWDGTGFRFNIGRQNNPNLNDATILAAESRAALYAITLLHNLLNRLQNMQDQKKK